MRMQFRLALVVLLQLLFGRMVHGAFLAREGAGQMLSTSVCRISKILVNSGHCTHSIERILVWKRSAAYLTRPLGYVRLMCGFVLVRVPSEWHPRATDLPVLLYYSLQCIEGESTRGLYSPSAAQRRPESVHRTGSMRLRRSRRDGYWDRVEGEMFVSAPELKTETLHVHGTFLPRQGARCAEPPGLGGTSLYVPCSHCVSTT